MSTLSQYRPLDGDITDDEWYEIEEILRERIARIRQADPLEVAYLELVNDLMYELQEGYDSI
jgi:hypothetical protein